MRISIEGLHGSGKTLLLNLLHKLNYNTRHTCPNNVWEELYQSDPHRYYLGYMLNILLNQINQSYNLSDIFLYENSPYTLQHVFSLTNVSHNCLHPEEQQLLTTISEKLSWHPECIIYLDCDPQVCLDRLIKQNNSSTLLSLEEMVNHAIEFDWILDSSNCAIPVYRVNANDNPINVFYHVLQILFQIKRHTNSSTSQKNVLIPDQPNYNLSLHALLLKKTEILQRILDES